MSGLLDVLGKGGGQGQSRAGQGRAGQGRAKQGRAGQGRAGQGSRAGQGRAGQGRAGAGAGAGQGQGRAGQGRAGQGGQGRKALIRGLVYPPVLSGRSAGGLGRSRERPCKWSVALSLGFRVGELRGLGIWDNT